MRRFNLIRNEDSTGISGTGIVAEGVEFTSGICVLSWNNEIKYKTAVYDSIDIVKSLHGHNGKTVIKWVDNIIFVVCEQCQSPLEKIAEGLIINNGKYWCDKGCYSEWQYWNEKDR